MKRRQTTLLGLMGIIAAIGVALASFLHPSPLVASLAWTGTLTLLIGAAIVAVLDPRRTFWVGFAVAGLIYAGFLTTQSDPWMSPLLSNKIIVFAFTSITKGLAYAIFIFFDNASSVRYRDQFLSDYRDTISVVMWTCQSIFALVHGCVGGYVAVWLRPRLLRSREVKSES